MRIETAITLQNGRTVSSDSVEFRSKLPVSADMLDRMALADDSIEGAFELISAVANAVVLLEARGVQFDD